MKPVRLARRFFASLLARPPGPAERAWVASVLAPTELALWERQPRYDLRHTIGVARRVERALGEGAEPRWLAAALLHDVGKVDSGLGVFGRVLATLAIVALGRARVRFWDGRAGLRGRFGRYALHGERGAAMIEAAGGRAEAAAWASVHHRLKGVDPGPHLPPPIVAVLHDCDRD